MPPSFGLPPRIQKMSPAKDDSAFSAESACYGGSPEYGWCGVDVLVDGVLAPAEDDDAFDSDDNTTETDGSWETHSLQRVIPVSQGTHTVTVQSFSANNGATFDLDDWTLTVLGIL